MTKKKLAYNLLAVSFGLSLLALAEGVLRLTQTGPSSRLFLKESIGDTVTYRVNSDVTHRFFQRQYRRHSPLDLRFNATKENNIFRVFALGASTLIGFPHPVRTSFPHFLETMLADVYPHRRFEIINCGITAINTFCLLDFAEEIRNYNPDLVVIYTGHNEFMGPYGVTTPFVRFGNDRRLVSLYLLLQRSRLFNIMEEGIYLLRRQTQTQEPAKEFGLHLAKQEIGPLDDGYQHTVSNYRINIDKILDTLSQDPIPVVLCTIVSNLRDFPPLRSNCDDISPGFDALMARGDLQLAQYNAESLLRKDPYCANLHFLLGRIYTRHGLWDRARSAFVQARDMDRLPFRAPQVFNHILRQQATTHSNTRLADVEKTFLAASYQGLIGNELITEYVHPNIYGNFLIAKTVIEALITQPPILDWPTAQPIRPYEAYLKKLDYGPEDRLSDRNNLIVFLRNLPYRRPPLVLRHTVAQLLRDQVADLKSLKPEDRLRFVERGGLGFLADMLDFLPSVQAAELRIAIQRLGGTL